MRVSRVKFRQSCSDWKNKDSPPDSDGFGNNSFMLSNKETYAALSTFPLPYGIDSSPASVAVLSFVEWERLIYSLAQSAAAGQDGYWTIPSYRYRPFQLVKLSRYVRDKPGSKNVGALEQIPFRGTIVSRLSISRAH